jgi:hypothetical protein
MFTYLKYIPSNMVQYDYIHLVHTFRWVRYGLHHEIHM